MSQDVKLYIFQQIHTPSGNRLTGSYFCSVTGYDKQTSFTALIATEKDRTDYCRNCDGRPEKISAMPLLRGLLKI